VGLFDLGVEEGWRGGWDGMGERRIGGDVREEGGVGWDLRGGLD
jgi:hypothetical protein